MSTLSTPCRARGSAARVTRIAVLLLLVLPAIQHAAAQTGTPGTPEAFVGPIQRGVLGHGFEVWAAPTPRTALLHLPRIQEELKISPAQRARLDALEQGNRAATVGLLEEFRNSLPPVNAPLEDEEVAEMQQRRQAMIMTREALKNEHEDNAFQVLTPQQKTRLNQIQLQSDGFSAFSRPDLQERLNMSPGQIEAVEDMVKEGRAWMWNNAVVSVPLPRAGESAEQRTANYEREVEKTRATVVKQRGLFLQQAGKVLSKKQLATYRRLLGEPFDFMKLRRDLGNAASAKDESNPRAKATSNTP